MASSSESSDEDLEKFAAIAGIVDTGKITLVFLWKHIRFKILQLSVIFWKHCLFLFPCKHHLEVSKKCNSDNSRGSSKPHTKPSLRLVLAFFVFKNNLRSSKEPRDSPFFDVDQNFISPYAFTGIIGFPMGLLPGQSLPGVHSWETPGDLYLGWKSPRVWDINGRLNSSAWVKDPRTYVQYLSTIRPLKRKMCARYWESTGLCLRAGSYWQLYQVSLFSISPVTCIFMFQYGLVTPHWCRSKCKNTKNTNFWRNLWG